MAQITNKSSVNSLQISQGLTTWNVLQINIETASLSVVLPSYVSHYILMSQFLQNWDLNLTLTLAPTLRRSTTKGSMDSKSWKSWIRLTAKKPPLLIFIALMTSPLTPNPTIGPIFHLRIYPYILLENRISSFDSYLLEISNFFCFLAYDLIAGLFSLLASRSKLLTFFSRFFLFFSSWLFVK